VRLPIEVAVDRAAAMLRGHVSAVLDDHPDVVLQLTGGQDSRVLLGAVEPARRRGLQVMTLASPGNPDAEIAASLAQRFGMRHRIIDLAGLADVDPDEAHAMAVAAARRLDGSANPIAEASISWAESRMDQQPRLAGLGGEVARGFYYIGPFRDVPVTRSRVQRLAEWRMFTNDSMSDQALDPAFAAQAKEHALDLLFHAFAERATSWFTATDEFYLLERMHRWSGVVASTTSMDRITINPMLDDRFLTIVRGLHPREKQNSLFLSRLSCALDAELSAIPLDGRPAPRIYARPTIPNRVRRAASTGQKIAGKVRQRLATEGRPPAGADLLTPRIADYYRANPGALAPVRDLGLLSARWLDMMVAGATPLDPGSAAMLVNLEVIADAVSPRA
jgi:asparagine synthase (glutamine-hydrolysing)